MSLEFFQLVFVLGDYISERINNTSFHFTSPFFGVLITNKDIKDIDLEGKYSCCLRKIKRGFC